MHNVNPSNHVGLPEIPNSFCMYLPTNYSGLQTYSILRYPLGCKLITDKSP